MPAPARPLRLIFMGTAAFAVPALETLAGSPHRILVVYSQPARPAGRGLKARPSPVAATAAALGLPVRTPASLRSPEEQAAFAALGADLAVVAAYGLLLPKPVLDTPRLGCINLHASLLPRWRGASPIQHALLAGDAESGVSIFQMEPGLDTGPVLALERVPIGPATTAGSLHDALATRAAGMLLPLIDAIAEGRAPATPQPADGVTYAPKLDRAAGRLDWSKPASDLERQVRAFEPRPGSWTELDGERLLVRAAQVVEAEGAPGEVMDDRLTVACERAALRLSSVQRAGGKPLAAEAFLRGFPVPPGTRLGRPCPATG